MKPWQNILLGFLMGLLASAAILLVATQPAGQPVHLIPAPTDGLITVQVSGAVFNPGLYQLPQGSRVQQALDAAGGALNSADPMALNLAATISDGMRIWVPRLNEITSTPAPASKTSLISTPSPSNPINLNTATQAELESLPGIGTTRAAQIIIYRQANGLFTQVSDLLKVEGITESVYEKIKGLVTVEGT
jgi:competence protein ComEA